jgi:Flp pilus assembly protein TadD
MQGKSIILTALVCFYFAVPAEADNCKDAVVAFQEGVKLGDGSTIERDHYLKAISLCSNLFEAHYNLGLYHLKNESFDQAKVSFEQAISQRKTPGVLVGLGSAQYRLGLFELAEKSFQEAIALDAEDTGAMMGLGVMYLDRSQFDKAEESFRNALQKAPDDPKMYYNLGMVLERAGRREEALVSYKTAIEKDSNFIDAQILFARLALQLGKVSEAEKTTRTITLLAPKRVDGWLALASLYDKQQNYTGSLDALKRAKEIDPSNPGIALSEGIALVKLDEVQQGIEQLKIAVANSPASSDAHGALGWAYLQQREVELAEQSLVRALELNSDNSFARNNMGVLLELKGDSDAAKTQYEHAMRVSQDLEEAKRNSLRVNED